MTGGSATVSGILSSLRAEFNRPFVYLLHDRKTGTVIFMGRVVDPTQQIDAN